MIHELLLAGFGGQGMLTIGISWLTPAWRKEKKSLMFLHMGWKCGRHSQLYGDYFR